MSKLQRIKNNSFPEATFASWKEEAVKALKGKSIDRLYTDTYEEITRKPVYTEEDLQQIETTSAMPGSFPFVRGSKGIQSDKADWIVSQQLYPSYSMEELNQQLQQELAAGSGAVHFSAYPAAGSFSLSLKTSTDLEALLNGLPLADIPLHVYAGKSATHFLSLLKNSNLTYESISGIIGADPIGELVQTGSLSEPLEDLYDEMFSAIQWKKGNLLTIKTIWIQGNIYHNSGANAVEELAAAMATGAAYLQALLERGVYIDEAASEIAFSFAVGSDLFMEIAKLRAARMLWANIVEAFGGDEDAQKLKIHATTSKFNKSTLDSYVNMLRTTTEAFSAVVGGAESINVDSFHLRTDSFSRRIARNTHYILKEESLLSQVVDPAAGSYYVETLTQQLAEKAWTLFQEIDEQGGIIEALNNNFIQEKIASTTAKRFKDVETRKRVLVGTNMYANLIEKFESQGYQNDVQAAATTILPLKPIRLSEPFERLREQAKKYEEKTSSKPTVAIINLGKLVSHKPRTDFASGFFHVGGLFTEVSPSLLTNSELEEWATTNINKGYVCFCGSDEMYSTMLEEAIKSIKGIKPEVKIAVAGYPEQERREALMKLGVNVFIHVKSNCFQQLLDIQQEMGLIPIES